MTTTIERQHDFVTYFIEASVVETREPVCVAVADCTCGWGYYDISSPVRDAARAERAAWAHWGNRNGQRLSGGSGVHWCGQLLGHSGDCL